MTKKYDVCDSFGCVGNSTYKVVAWIHPLNGHPVYRNYCFAHVPVHCPVCKYSIGVRFMGIEKKPNRRVYKCLNCNGEFYLDVIRA